MALSHYLKTLYFLPCPGDLGFKQTVVVVESRPFDKSTVSGGTEQTAFPPSLNLNVVHVVIRFSTKGQNVCSD